MHRLLCKSSLALTAAFVCASFMASAEAATAAPRRAQADLVVARITASGSAQPGGVLTVQHRLRNAGPARARGSALGYYLAGRASKRPGGIRLAVRSTPALKPGRTLRRSVKLILPGRLAKTSYVLLVCADVSKRVAESREANNCRSSARLTVVQRTPQDESAPTVPVLSEHPADPTTARSARFAFSSVGAAAFQCRLDGGPFAACGSPSLYEGLGDGGHAFAVRALSSRGRASEVTEFSWRIDLTPPHLPWFTEAPATPTRARSASFAFASDPGATFTCRLDEGTFAPCASPVFVAGPLAEGEHRFAVKARDALGNETLPNSFSWTVDLTPPARPTLVAHPDDPSNDQHAAFTFAGAPEPGGEWRCRLDHGPWTTCTNPQAYAGPLAQGSHDFSVIARDQAGNESAPQVIFSWTIDTTPPPVPVITAVPDNPSEFRTASFVFSDTEPGVTFRCWIDQGAVEVCLSPHAYTSLTDGEHRWQVVAQDEAGNWSAPATARWMIDTTAPPAAGFDLGVFTGGRDPAGVVAFRDWLRRPITRVLEYFSYQTWAEIASPIQIDTWRGRGYNMVYSVPMLPESGATLAQGATGAYNVHFRHLAERLVGAGHGNSVIRLGWEFNGFWYPWTAMNDPSSFILYWRQIVNTMRATPGASFTFDWCIVFGPASIDADDAYPGDAWVDYIGISAFDQDWYPGWQDPHSRWRNFINLPFGLQWQRDFARAHGKRLVVDEWALSIRSDGHGGGDNPYYVERMYHWFNARDLLADGRPRLAWGIYFEADKPDSLHRLLGGSFPLGAQRAKALFGNVY